MKPLFKIILVLAFCFASTFVIANATGLLTVEKIETWLEVAKTLSPIYVAGIIIVLLFADLFIAVPTLTVIILAGFFLGHGVGAVSAIMGLMLVGICGYILSYIYGEKIINFLVKKKEQQEEAKATFIEHGFAMILLSRAMPILPEVSACLAGMTRMRFVTFMAAWSLSTIPYALIATYAGSISTLENPKPAIFTAIGLSGLFWLGWYIFNRRKRLQD